MQLTLFHPAPKDPRWEQLPWEIRQQSVHLLARMLREHWRADLSLRIDEGGPR